MKKNILVTVSLLAIAGLTACGQTSSITSVTSDKPVTSDTSVTSEKTADATEISLWVSQADSPAVTAWEAGFNKANPSSPVKLKFTTMEEGDVGDKFTSDPESVPDIVHLPGDVLTKLEASGSVSSFSSADVKSVIGSDISAGALAGGQDANGVQYGLPYAANTYFLYYDKAVYTEEQVATYDALFKQFDAYKAAQGLDASNRAIAPQLDNGWYIQSYFMSNEGIFADNGTSATETNVVTKGLPVARTIANIYKSGDVSNATNTTDFTKCFAFISGAWDYKKVADAWGAENVGFAHIPDLTVGGKTVTHKGIGDNKYVAVAASSKKAALAKKVALYMDSAEGQLARWKANSGTVVTSAKVAASADYLKGTPAINGVLATLAHGTFAQNTSTQFGKWWDASTAFTGSLYTAVTGEDGTAKNEVSDDELTTLLNTLQTALLAK
jgi:arabinogalactan oligomer/maltooligosaccharide transport system substrate-binding protein